MAHSKIAPIGRTRKAKARPNPQVAYQVEIIGQTWEGFTSSYSYSFDHLPTDSEIHGRAGDFRSLIDYEITRFENRSRHVGGKTIETRSHEVVREWASPDSEETWLSCH